MSMAPKPTVGGGNPSTAPGQLARSRPQSGVRGMTHIATWKVHRRTRREVRLVDEPFFVFLPAQRWPGPLVRGCRGLGDPFHHHAGWARGRAAWLAALLSKQVAFSLPGLA